MLSLTNSFLAQHHPFDQLPPEVCQTLEQQLELSVIHRGETLWEIGEPAEWLGVLRQGAIELLDSQNELLGRLGEGDLFGQQALLAEEPRHEQAVVLEDGFLYRIPAPLFYRLYREHRAFAYFFNGGSERLRQALRGDEDDEHSLINLRVVDLLTRAPITLTSSATVTEAAQRMTQERVSAMLIVDEQQRLVGIVTDRDLRSRVLATELPGSTPLAQVMTSPPKSTDAHTPAYGALLQMARYRLHHLPVLDGERVLGMITATDLIQRRAHSPVYLAGDIHKCNDLAGLQTASAQLPNVLLQLVENGASAHSIGHLISSLGEAITQRLLQLAEAELGPPPVAYAWLIGGSQARAEQTAHSDQDSCLLLSPDYNAEQHGEYFRALTKRVCDDLNACGYVYCPGDIMATNPRWHQPLPVWRRMFTSWIETPEPEALLNASVFFDLRCIYGDRSLFDELQHYVLRQTPDNQIFLGLMAANALRHQPPLGFFRNFVLVRGGDHDHTLDLKLRGVVPIIDLARVLALTMGSPAVNTRERLEDAVAGRLLAQAMSHDLGDALEFIASVRLRHQANRIRQSQAADNYLPPESLSHFERNHLKDAFSVVRDVQNLLAQRYPLARIS